MQVTTTTALIHAEPGRGTNVDADTVTGWDIVVTVAIAVTAVLTALGLVLRVAWKVARPHVEELIRSVRDTNYHVKPNGGNSAHDRLSRDVSDVRTIAEQAARAAQAATRNVTAWQDEAKRIGQQRDARADTQAGVLEEVRGQVGEVRGQVGEVAAALEAHVAESRAFLPVAITTLAQHGIHLTPPDQQEEGKD